MSGLLSCAKVGDRVGFLGLWFELTAVCRAAEDGAAPPAELAGAALAPRDHAATRDCRGDDVPTIRRNVVLWLEFAH